MSLPVAHIQQQICLIHLQGGNLQEAYYSLNESYIISQKLNS